MSMHIRRRFISLILKKGSSFLCEPRVCLPVYFSTCKNKQPCSNPTSSDFLTQKYNFLPQADSQLASVLTTLKKTRKSDTILSFFVESGFSSTQLEKILKSWPQLLSLNLDKIIKPKFKIFQDFGFSANEIAEVISNDPSILHSSADKRVTPSLSVLKALLGSTTKVAKVLKVCGWYAKSDLDNTLVPNINFLMSCGVDVDKIFWIMSFLPRILLQKPEKLKKYVAKADQMGAIRSSKMFIHAVRVVSSMNDESWELKLKAFRDVGFLEQDICSAFRTAPLVFAVSEEKMKKVKEIILATGKYDMSCILKNPTSLCRSIEKRYKPRIEVLKILEGKGLIKKWPSLSAISKLPDKDFFEKFVCPYYDEVGKVYMSMTGLSGESEF